MAVVSLAALQDARVFRAGQALSATRDGLPSGLAALDEALPWGGFPRGALTEVLYPRDGIGEFELLLPALRRLLQRGRIAWVAPPYPPYAPALAQAGLPLARVHIVEAKADRALWAAEQCLRAGCLDGVLAWTAGGDDRALRRLQVAAEQGGTHGWLFRPLRHAANPSPAALRLQVGAGQVRIVKCRGAVACGLPLAYARPLSEPVAAPSIACGIDTRSPPLHRLPG